MTASTMSAAVLVDERLRPSRLSQRSRILDLALRTAVLVASTWLCLGAASLSLLDILAPAQRAVFSTLMSEYSIKEFGVQRMGAQLKLRERTVSAEYLIVRGRAYAPGVEFEAETPARTALVYIALIIGGAALTIRGSTKPVMFAWVVTVLTALLMAVVAPSVLLAGAHWSVAYRAFEEASPPAVLVGVSDFLIHGGGYALCAAAVWSAAVVGRRSRSLGR